MGIQTTDEQKARRGTSTRSRGCHLLDGHLLTSSSQNGAHAVLKSTRMLLSYSISPQFPILWQLCEFSSVTTFCNPFNWNKLITYFRSSDDVYYRVWFGKKHWKYIPRFPMIAIYSVTIIEMCIASALHWYAVDWYMLKKFTLLSGSPCKRNLFI